MVCGGRTSSRLNPARRQMIGTHWDETCLAGCPVAYDFTSLGPGSAHFRGSNSRTLLSIVTRIRRSPCLFLCLADACCLSPALQTAPAGRRSPLARKKKQTHGLHIRATLELHKWCGHRQERGASDEPDTGRETWEGWSWKTGICLLGQEPGSPILNSPIKQTK